jgi:hypothetical protein
MPSSHHLPEQRPKRSKEKERIRERNKMATFKFKLSLHLLLFAALETKQVITGSGSRK